MARVQATQGEFVRQRLLQTPRECLAENFARASL